jgi:PKD domain-containing protein/peptidase M28-like protein
MRFRQSFLRIMLVTAMGLALCSASVLPGGVSGGVAQADPAGSGQDRPVIDTGFLYRELYDMSSIYIFRASGLDGPPQDPSSPNNLPPNVNGWQEFYAHWKQQMTSQKAMGPMAAFLKVSDHFFRVSGFPFDSNVAEVTIPGAACPGQRVLLASHPDSTPSSTRVADLIDQGDFTGAMARLNSSNLGNGSAYDDTTGVAMGMAEFKALLRWWDTNHAWPARTIKIGLFDAEETGLFGSFFYAANLIPQGPQGQYVLVANMDQNGLEYPALHWGTDHYFNDLRNGGVGPWFTNINASPLEPNDVYNGDDFKNIEANLPAIKAFRAALNDSVTEAFQTLGRKYGFQVPMENPLLMANLRAGTNPKRSVPAYTPEDQQRFSPVQDDKLGRTDQVPFVARGIPGYGVLGAFDSNEVENPYPANYTNKPVIRQYAGYDTLVDDIQHLNYWASGIPHGVRGIDAPSEELRRALELPSTWTDYLVSRPEYGGAVARPRGPVAYFETTPVLPGTALTVNFDASFSADAGRTGGLAYFWDFGDGTAGTGRQVSHTFTAPAFADVKLVVVDRHGHRSAYRQAVPVGGGTAPAPATPACGTVPDTEAAAVVRTAADPAASIGATRPWTPKPSDFTDPRPVTSKLSAADVDH